MRVLLVEDDAAIAALIHRYLGRYNHPVSVFGTSPEALEAFRADPSAFDIAVTDLSLKDMSGEELVVKLLGLNPGLPVVIATGYAYSPDHLDAGVRRQIRVLQKPFLPKQLIELLTEAVPDGASGSAPSPPAKSADQPSPPAAPVEAARRNSRPIRTTAASAAPARPSRYRARDGAD